MNYIHGLSDAAYHADSSRIGSSTLRKVTRQSPAHALEALLHPSLSTPDMKFGTAVHLCALQPEVFACTYLEGPDGPLNRNPWKAELAALREAFPGKEILKPSDMDKVEECAASVHSAIVGLLGSEAFATELTGRATVEAVEVKTRVDVLQELTHHIVDVKTSKDVQRPWSAVRAYGYDFQAAMYVLVHKIITGVTPRFTFLSVEKTRPYGVICYELPDSWLQRAIKEVSAAAKLYAHCRNTGEFPSYSREILELVDNERSIL